MGFYKNVNTDIKEWNCDYDRLMSPGDVRKIHFHNKFKRNEEDVDIKHSRHFEYDYYKRYNDGFSADYTCINSSKYKVYGIAEEPILREIEVTTYTHKWEQVDQDIEIGFEVRPIEDLTTWKRRSAQSRHACNICALHNKCYDIDHPLCCFNKFTKSGDFEKEGKHYYYFKELFRNVIEETITPRETPEYEEIIQDFSPNQFSTLNK